MDSNKKTFEKSDWKHYVKLWSYGHDVPMATISRIIKNGGLNYEKGSY